MMWRRWLCALCACVAYSRRHMSQIGLVVSTATRTYITQVMLGVNWIILNINMSSYHRWKMELSRTPAPAPTMPVRSEGKRVCVCECVRRSPIRQMRGTFQGAAAQVKVTFCCAPLACVCVVLLEGIGYTPTDRPTARYVKIVYMGTWNMICQAPSKKRREDITRIKYSFYALGFISSTYVQCIP